MGYSISEVVVLFPALLIILLGAILVGHLLKDKSEKVKNIPFLCVTIIMLVLEVIKQARLFILDAWSWWAFPIHFCSMFMIWFSLDSFGKGKVKETGRVLSFVSCFMFILLFYFGPTTIIGDSCKNVFESFSSFHTFTYHHLILVYLFLMITLKRYKAKPKKDIIKILFCFSIYFVVLVTLANVTQTNYTNMLYSNIPFMQAWLDFAGYIPYVFTMYLIGIGIPIATVFITNLIQKKLNKEKTND